MQSKNIVMDDTHMKVCREYEYSTILQLFVHISPIWTSSHLVSSSGTYQPPYSRLVRNRLFSEPYSTALDNSLHGGYYGCC